MRHAHHHIIIAAGRHFQFAAFKVDHQRMIAGCGKRRRNKLKDSLTVMPNNTGLAVHRYRGLHRAATEDLIDTLQPETDTQDRYAAAKAADNRDGIASMGRIFGTGADENIVKGVIYSPDFWDVWQSAVSGIFYSCSECMGACPIGSD